MIRTESVDKFISQCYKPINSQMEALRKEGEKDHIPIILKETEMYLSSILPIINPARILEIGAAIGYSTLFFSHICPESIILSVERDDDLWNMAKRNVRNQKKEGQIFIGHGDAMEFMQMLFKAGDWEAEPFDFVFIDGAKGHYKDFLEIILPITRSGTVIVCDNILMKGMTADEEINKRYRTSIKRMRSFVDYLYQIPGSSTQILSVGDGISVTRIY